MTAPLFDKCNLPPKTYSAVWKLGCKLSRFSKHWEPLRYIIFVLFLSIRSHTLIYFFEGSMTYRGSTVLIKKNGTYFWNDISAQSNLVPANSGNSPLNNDSNYPAAQAQFLFFVHFIIFDSGLVGFSPYYKSHFWNNCQGNIFLRYWRQWDRAGVNNFGGHIFEQNKQAWEFFRVCV